jgi:hypothetical protein
VFEKPGVVNFEMIEQESEITLSTKECILTISKNPVRFSL